MSTRDIIQAIAEARVNPDSAKLPKGYPLVGTIKNGCFIVLAVKK